MSVSRSRRSIYTGGIVVGVMEVQLAAHRFDVRLEKDPQAPPTFRLRFSDIRRVLYWWWLGKEPAMTTHLLRFVELSDQERKATKPLDKLGKGDHVEVKVRRKSGPDQIVRLPPTAAALI